MDGYGILVRGGILRGQLMHEKGMVVGPAMIEAYLLESNMANFPRIIIAQDLKEQIESDLKEYIQTQRNLSKVPGYNKLFKTDDDGWCYLDYINPDENYYELDKAERLDNLEWYVQQNLQSPNEHVKEKYLWLLKKIEPAKATSI